MGRHILEGVFQSKPTCYFTNQTDDLRNRIIFGEVESWSTEGLEHRGRFTDCHSCNKPL